MRRGINNRGIYAHEGQFVAINLGADFAAEHEWGIKDLKKTFGIDPEKEKPFGYKRRLIKKNQTLFVRGQKYAMVIGDSQWHLDELAAKITPDNIDKKVKDSLTSARHQCYPFHHDAICVETTYDRDSRKSVIDPEWEFTGAWSGRDFGILFNLEKPHVAQAYEDLKSAFEEKDLVFFIGGGMPGNPFDRGGLTLAIASRIPEEGKKSMVDSDRDAYELDRADKKTGIRKKLQKKLEEEQEKSGGRTGFFQSQYRFIALSPKWFREGQFTREDEKGERVALQTKHRVVYWLNPGDQQNCLWGYVTVEELEQWIEGHGPILDLARSKVGN